jgi:hypothetical protein
MIAHAADVQAAWARIVVAHFSERISDVDHGRLSDHETIALTGTSNNLYLLDWKDRKWDVSMFQELCHGAVAILPGRNDKVGRIYCSSVGAPDLIEITPTAKGLEKRLISLPGEGSGVFAKHSFTTTGKSARLIVSRVFSGPTELKGRCSEPRHNYKLYECAWGSDWTCSPIGPACWGRTLLLNPPGKRDFDVLIGSHGIWEKHQGENWSYVGIADDWGFLEASHAEENTFYSGTGSSVYRDDYLKIDRRSFTRPPTRISGAVARMRPDGKERVYMGADDRHLYENERSEAGWTATDIGRTAGVPNRLFAGAIRGDGRTRLYLIEDDSSSSDLVEYTYYKEKSRVAIHDFAVSGDPAGGTILGSMLRAELSAFGHLEILETKDIDSILAERDFQASRCSDDACIAKIGKLAKAAASITGSLVKGAEETAIELRVVDTKTGRRLFTLQRRVPSNGNILPVVKELANQCAANWPN